MKMDAPVESLDDLISVTYHPSSSFTLAAMHPDGYRLSVHFMQYSMEEATALFKGALLA